MIGDLNIENVNIKVRFPEEQIDWLLSGHSSHAEFEIIPSKDYFKKLKPTLKEGREKYRNYLNINRGPTEL